MSGLGSIRDKNRQHGFTLLEILVALCILGILATSVTLSLPDPVASAQREVLQTWQRQLAWTARQARAGGEVWAWELVDGKARILQRRDGHWQDVEDSQPELPRPLSGSAKLNLEQAEIDGLSSHRQLRIVFAGTPPIFRLQFAAPSEAGEQHWLLIGQANGMILLEPA